MLLVAIALAYALATRSVVLDSVHQETEPLLTDKEPDAAYVGHHVLRLLELTAARRITEVKSRLQRTNPVDEPESYNRMFGELAALEQHRRALRDRVVGA